MVGAQRGRQQVAVEQRVVHPAEVRLVAALGISRRRYVGRGDGAGDDAVGPEVHVRQPLALGGKVLLARLLPLAAHYRVYFVRFAQGPLISERSLRVPAHVGRLVLEYNTARATAVALARVQELEVVVEVGVGAELAAQAQALDRLQLAVNVAQQAVAGVAVDVVFELENDVGVGEGDGLGVVALAQGAGGGVDIGDAVGVAGRHVGEGRQRVGARCPTGRWSTVFRPSVWVRVAPRLRPTRNHSFTSWSTLARNEKRLSSFPRTTPFWSV